MLVVGRENFGFMPSFRRPSFFNLKISIVYSPQENNPSTEPTLFCAPHGTATMASQGKAKRKTVLSDDDAAYSEGDEDGFDDDDEGYIEVKVPTLFGNNIEDEVEEPDFDYPTERKQLNLFLFHQKAPQICGFFTKNLQGIEDMNRFVLPSSDQITEANDMLSEEMRKLRFRNGKKPCSVAVFRVTDTTETLCGIFPCLKSSGGATQGLKMWDRHLNEGRLLEKGEEGILCKSGSIRVKAIACLTGESFSSIKARVDLFDPDRTRFASMMKEIIAQSVTGDLELKEADGRINVKNGGDNYKCLNDAVRNRAFNDRVPLRIWDRLPKHLAMKYSAPTTGKNKGRTLISVGLIQEYQLHVDMNGVPSANGARQIRFIDPGFDSSKIRNARDYVPTANMKQLAVETEERKKFKKEAKREKSVRIK
jgi:hypothetical protein